MLIGHYRRLGFLSYKIPRNYNIIIILFARYYSINLYLFIFLCLSVYISSTFCDLSCLPLKKIKNSLINPLILTLSPGGAPGMVDLEYTLARYNYIY